MILAGLGNSKVKREDYLESNPNDHFGLTSLGSSDAKLQLLKTAKENSQLTQSEGTRLNLIEKAKQKISDRVFAAAVDFSDILLNPVGFLINYGIDEIRKNNFKQFSKNLGIVREERNQIWQDANSNDPQKKQCACHKLFKIIAEKTDSISVMKKVILQIEGFNKISEKKVSGITKLKSSIERLERATNNLAEEFRLRKGEHSHKNSKNSEGSELKPETNKEQASTETNFPEYRQGGLSSEPDNTHMLEISIDSMEHARELLIEIAGVEQELNNLRSKHPAFSVTDLKTLADLAALENKEDKMRRQLANFLEQGTVTLNRK